MSQSMCNSSEGTARQQPGVPRKTPSSARPTIREPQGGAPPERTNVNERILKVWLERNMGCKLSTDAEKPNTRSNSTCRPSAPATPDPKYTERDLEQSLSRMKGVSWEQVHDPEINHPLSVHDGEEQDRCVMSDNGHFQTPVKVAVTGPSLLPPPSSTHQQYTPYIKLQLYDCHLDKLIQCHQRALKMNHFSCHGLKQVLVIPRTILSFEYVEKSPVKPSRTAKRT
ncbi:hypothetical protein B0H19DRAFT_1224467 [Mycena capillaripes]|nr:hypothetical protein B0H19DRAFT_1224467 [Mycena capillaripes]